MNMAILDKLPSRLQAVIQSPKFRVLLGALLSAITWFCWAYWANRQDPDQAWVSGFYQGGVNLFTTAFGSAALELLFVRMGATFAGRALCVAIVSTISLSFMIAAHLIAQTPNMLLTIAPVYSVVVLYCSSYIFSLQKLKQHEEFNETAQLYSK
ncbi:MAG: hypothetical protein MI976_06915 [Pseudomonadales bacterium]|nr:hypothetical protein [Pseudomonadales bacterium]